MPDLSGWNENIPSDGSNVGVGAADIRSQVTTLATGLGEWLQFPGSGGGVVGGAGRLKAGASRFFFAAESASSNSDGPTLNQRGFLSSDDTRLIVYESSSSRRMGGSDTQEHSLASTNRFWLNVSDVTEVDSGTLGTFTLRYETWKASSPPQIMAIFGDIPIVHISSDDTRYFLSISTATTGGFTSLGSFVGTVENVVVRWMASGWTDGTI